MITTKKIINTNVPTLWTTVIDEKYNKLSFSFISDFLDTIQKYESFTCDIIMDPAPIDKVVIIIPNDSKWSCDIRGKIKELDIIIALGMAKEGFDWPFCEHALTVGYRGSLTEII